MEFTVNWSPLGFTFLLLVIYQLKHFVADFPLQCKYMLQKDKPGWDFFLPLAAHSAVHGAITLVIVLAVAPHLWWLALLDFTIHFTMDRIKSGPRYLGRYCDSLKAAYWNCFGWDQMVHHLTHYSIIWVIVCDLFGL